LSSSSFRSEVIAVKKKYQPIVKQFRNSANKNQTCDRLVGKKMSLRGKRQETIGKKGFFVSYIISEKSGYRYDVILTSDF